MQQYEIMEPDSVDIAYLDADNKVYDFYYDFKSQKYTESHNSGVDAAQWSDSDLAKMVPQIEARVLDVRIDDEDDFSFKAFGISKNDYDSYIESCKAYGFIKEQYDGTSGYIASNSNGYELEVSYDMNDEELYVSVDAP